MSIKSLTGNRQRQLAAWGVHLYTASGAIVGMFALYAAAEGRIRDAFGLLVVTMLIDATDGMLARRVRVREALPGFDGGMVDNVVDVFTFVWIPVFIMWSQQLLPHPLWTAVPVLATLYAYGQVNMKTDDDFFLGFPSYWSVVALYLFWLQPTPIVAVLLIVVPAILSFIPTRYLYPSKGDVLWRTTWGFTAIWLVMVVYMLTLAQPPAAMVALSLFFPVYYMAASFYVDWQIRRGNLEDPSMRAVRSS